MLLVVPVTNDTVTIGWAEKAIGNVIINGVPDGLNPSIAAVEFAVCPVCINDGLVKLPLLKHIPP